MDYLPTLGETWPHSKGEIRINIPYLEHLGLYNHITSILAIRIDCPTITARSPHRKSPSPTVKTTRETTESLGNPTGFPLKWSTSGRCVLHHVFCTYLYIYHDKSCEYVHMQIYTVACINKLPWSCLYIIYCMDLDNYIRLYTVHSVFQPCERKHWLVHRWCSNATWSSKIKVYVHAFFIFSPQTRKPGQSITLHHVYV